MSKIHIVRDYPHPPATVWRAVTDPELITEVTYRSEPYGGGTRFTCTRRSSGRASRDIPA
jgi:hypothetical protein